MDRITAMRVFVEVAGSGSFSASADKLDMSRAMVTRYISEMEKWLGTRLLQRTTRRVTLTDAGETCLRRSQQMLALSENMEEETASGGELRGLLRVTCSLSFGHAQLAQALVRFTARHPLLNIDLNLNEGALNLVEARIDLAIRISAEPSPLLIARPLAQCDSLLVAAPAYLAARGAPAAPRELEQHRCLSHANVGRSIWSFARDDEALQVGVLSYFSANDATALLASAVAGGGIAMLPTYLVNPVLASGALVRVLPQWQMPALTIYAIYPSRRQLSPAVRALLDFLVDHFAVQPW
ncbi:LysR family transcriptional regulator [Massilia antarctica]|uniref:LysR family transcriptional regulator n=1 Tax=Massilia antarctica TaxID=2765360 RepID=UPI0006BB8EA2|nr:LysR family transcriptional regulator [Massilia sp. H27-R4]MCY0911264.1 LysR family transcriptional regulator [Massilia sp. H27-R4]CUI05141.1 LysR-family transcriptional regulator clustered with PA0057 [Janthinobacterium sp. CG23_2]CUU28927.1 LysR-family transcriptional regulator clustered with PA0057 [Janthinobacterium sp. CG23_2]